MQLDLELAHKGRMFDQELLIFFANLLVDGAEIIADIVEDALELLLIFLAP